MQDRAQNTPPERKEAFISPELGFTEFSLADTSRSLIVTRKAGAATSLDRVDLASNVLPRAVEKRQRKILFGLEAQCSAALRAVDGVVLPPELQHLRIRPEQLRSRFAAVRDHLSVNYSAAVDAVRAMPPKEARRGFGEVMSRLEHETQYVAPVCETGLRYEPQGKGFNGSGIWRLPPLLARLILGRDTGGTVIAAQCVVPRLPEGRVMWQHLLIDGTLPFEVAALTHEMVHRTQLDLKFFLRGAIPFAPVSVWAPAILALQPPVSFVWGSGLAIIGLSIGLAAARARWEMHGLALCELHAWDATLSLPCVPIPEKPLDAMPHKHRVLQHVLSYKYLANNFTKLELSSAGSVLEIAGGNQCRQATQILPAAYDALHALRLLGVSDREIGAGLTNIKLDRATGRFSALEERLAAERRKLALEDANTFDVVQRALEAHLILRRFELRQEARRVAAEVARSMPR